MGAAAGADEEIEMQTIQQAITTIAAFPVTDERRNMDAMAMKRIAKDAAEGDALSAASAAAVPIDGYNNLIVDDVAAALRQRQQGGKQLLPWSRISNASKKKWIELATFTLDQFRLAHGRHISANSANGVNTA